MAGVDSVFTGSGQVSLSRVGRMADVDSIITSSGRKPLSGAGAMAGVDSIITCSGRVSFSNRSKNSDSKTFWSSGVIGDVPDALLESNREWATVSPKL